MIEPAIKTSLEDITGLTAWPLLLPPSLLEGASYQLISDPLVDAGMVRTRLVAARYQIRLSLLNDYTRLHTLDRAIWSVWRTVRHSELSGVPVQTIDRGVIAEHVAPQANGSMLYSLARDYILYYTEELS